MSATSITLRGRRSAEALMLDTCTITRTTGSTTEPDSGVVTPTTTQVYAGKCKVQQSAGEGSPKELGEASVQMTQLQLHVPMSATGVAVDDVATITAAALDPDLVGKRFTVRGPLRASLKTARRLSVQEVGS